MMTTETPDEQNHINILSSIVAAVADKRQHIPLKTWVPILGCFLFMLPCVYRLKVVSAQVCFRELPLATACSSLRLLPYGMGQINPVM